MADTLKDRNIFIIINSPVTSKVLSGSDKIFIKIIEEISLLPKFKIKLLVCPEAKVLCQKSIPESHKIEYINLNYFNGENLNILVLYFLRIIFSVKVLFLKIPKDSIIISSSDFLTDFIPQLLIYFKYKRENRYFSSMFMRKEKSEKETLTDFLYRKSQEFNIYFTKYLEFKIFTNPIDIEYLQKKGINSQKILTLLGGIDYYELENLTQKKYTACFVGRINPVKGISRMLDIWSRFIKLNPTAVLGMVCSGTKAQEESLKKEIKEKKLENNVKYLGFLDNKEKYQVLSNSEMFLLPSYYESFGIVILEAFSMKLPIICFDIEPLRYNFDQRLIFSKDEEDFKKNIIRVLKEKNRLDSLIEDNYKFSQGFTWKKTSQKFLNDLV